MAAVWGAGLPAEVFLPEEPSVECRWLEGTFGRPLEAGWAYPSMDGGWCQSSAMQLWRPV